MRTVHYTNKKLLKRMEIGRPWCELNRKHSAVRPFLKYKEQPITYKQKMAKEQVTRRDVNAQMLVLSRYKPVSIYGLPQEV